MDLPECLRHKALLPAQPPPEKTGLPCAKQPSEAGAMDTRWGFIAVGRADLLSIPRQVKAEKIPKQPLPIFPAVAFARLGPNRQVEGLGGHSRAGESSLAFCKSSLGLHSRRAARKMNSCGKKSGSTSK